MKKLFSLLFIVLIITVSNCTDIPENNDPILGIWTRTDFISEDSKSSSTTKEEWIFNDVYLGRYQRYTDNTLTFYTDFKWSNENDSYTITYTGTDIEEVTVSLEVSNEPETLALENGAVFATRE
ncbi:hypothetical protein [Flagellimonas sp.]|uniref:hypothetical protein n=1 Tax=Flagellimonas sp. TaxID=2058762 RepID=UPI003F4A72CF